MKAKQCQPNEVDELLAELRFTVEGLLLPMEDRLPQCKSLSLRTIHAVGLLRQAVKEQPLSIAAQTFNDLSVMEDFLAVHRVITLLEAREHVANGGAR